MTSNFNFKKFIFKNIGFIAILVISALYITKGLFEISESGLTVYEILGNGLLTMAIGFGINTIFRQSGLLYGEEDADVISANNLHERVVDEITPYLDLLDGFCKTENESVLKEQRSRILAACGMKYSDYFDEDGVSKPVVIKRAEGEDEDIFEKRKKEMLKCLKKAVKLKITFLTPSSLTCDGAKSEDPFDFGMTKSQYQAKRSGFDVVSRIALGVLFGYFTLKKAENFSYEEMLWSALQIAVYIVFGVAQMVQSYMFIKTEDRSRIIKKTDLLQKFKIYAQRKEEKNGQSYGNEEKEGKDG